MGDLIEHLGGDARVLMALRIGVLLFARLVPLTVLAPWLALRTAPAMVRAGVALGLTLALVPVALPHAAAPPVHMPLAPLVLREAVVGAAFAVASSLPFFALDWAGRLVDTWRGAALAEVIAPPTGERTSPLGDLQLLFGVALFAAVGGHRVALGAFAEGLRRVPVGAPSLLTGLESTGLGAASLVASALALGVAFAAPAVVVLLLVDAVLGAIGRMAPQIPLFFAGMPLRALGGVAACLLAVPVLGDALPGAFEATIAGGRALLLRFGAP